MPSWRRPSIRQTNGSCSGRGSGSGALHATARLIRALRRHRIKNLRIQHTSEVEVSVSGQEPASARGRSKRAAEQAAAKRLLDRVGA